MGEIGGSSTAATGGTAGDGESTGGASSWFGRFRTTVPQTTPRTTRLTSPTMKDTPVRTGLDLDIHAYARRFRLSHSLNAAKDT